MEHSSDEQFKKYGSFENHDHNIIKNFQAHFPDEDWIALEKVHGSNLSFIVQQIGSDSYDVKLAKRTSILSPEEEITFYNCALIKARYELNATKLFQHVKLLNPTMERLHIFGEFMGGRHKNADGDIIADKDSKYPQKEIKYCQRNEFTVFDVYVIDIDPLKNGYMNYNEVIECCDAYNFIYLPILHRGTLSEMLALNPSFPTTIPKLLGCHIGNEDEAEGFVIKTTKTMYLPGRPYRAIFKYKAPAFREKGPVVKIREPRAVVNISEDTRELSHIAVSYVTEGRLIGKLPYIPDKSNTPKNIEKITGILVGDVVSELKRDGFTFENKQSRHYITSLVTEASRELVKSTIH